MCKGCSHGTLLHLDLQSSRLNIRYYHQDLHNILFNHSRRCKLQHNISTPLHAYHLNSYKRLGIGCPLQRYPFSGLVHSTGELLHTP